jgi:hypothetical protein
VAGGRPLPGALEERDAFFLAAICNLAVHLRQGVEATRRPRAAHLEESLPRSLRASHLEWFWQEGWISLTGCRRTNKIGS